MTLKIVLFTILGFALIIIDLLFLPGGFLVAAGAALILYSVYLNLAEPYGIPRAIVHLLVCIAITPKLITWSLRRISLKKEMNKDDGYVGVEDHTEMLGWAGSAFSDLRPSGMVILDNHDEHLDCIAESGYIEKGSRVEVVEERGPSLVVRKIREGQLGTNTD